MSFVPLLFYIALSLLSPDVLPDLLREVHIIEVLGIITILTSIPGLARSGMARLPNTYLVTGILLAATLSIIGTGWLGGAVTTFVGFVPIIFTYYFVVTACQKPGHLVALTYVMFAVLCFILVQGTVAETIGNFDSPYLIREGVAGMGDLYRHRGLGVLSDPNDLAQVLVTVLPLLWLRWKKGAFGGNLLLTVIPAVILVIGIYQTHSRGGIFALIAMMLYGFKDKLGLIKGTLLAGFCTLTVFALNFSGGRSMNNDDGERVSLWGQALDTFRAHPLVGIGMGRFADYSDLGLTAHNSYVLCLAELGLIGYFFWMGAIVTSWYGLSEITPKKVGKELEEAAPELMETSEPAFSSERNTAIHTFAGRPGVASLALASGLSTMPSGFVLPTSYGAPPGALEEEDVDEETLAYYARPLHAAFVGLLVSAFFLSRTYSMIFYIIFGMSAAVQAMYRRKHPEVTTQFGPLLKRIVLIICVSVVGLYLFVRLHGVS